MTTRTVADYLEALRQALAGAPRGLVRDALADAEEHLRAALAQQSSLTEAEVLAGIIESYGTPEQVADEYRGMDARLRPRAAAPDAREEKDGSLLGRFFGVVIDPRAYTALFYIYLAPFTGAFYFFWVTMGLSFSIGLLTVVVGALVFLVFVGSVRLLSLVEGRIVESLLGVPMPRRQPYEPVQHGILAQISTALLDQRTWTSILYMAAMLPLGLVYYGLVTTGLALCFLLIYVPLAVHLWDADTGLPHSGTYRYNSTEVSEKEWFARMGENLSDWAPWLYETLHPCSWQLALMAVAGVLCVFLTLHLAKGIGVLHGRLAEHLLVRLPG